MPERHDKEDDIIRRMRECIRRYDMASADDHIICAASGGKDSTVLLIGLATLFPGRVKALTFDPHIPEYSDINLANLENLCRRLDIPLIRVSLKGLHDVTLAEFRERLGERAPTYCTICGVLKRYYLNLYARREGATVIATGHNRDDVVQSHLMNLLRGTPSASARLGPVSGVAADRRFIPRIKPLIMVSEQEILEYTRKEGLQVDTSSCPFSEDAYRRTIKDALGTYEQARPGMQARVLERFLSDLDSLKEYFRTEGSPAACTVCGEPCQQEMCTACSLLSRAGLLDTR